MKLVNFVTATAIGILLNIQAMGISTSFFQETPQNQTGKITTAAAITSQNISRNWSGYGATDGNYTGIKGTWTIPSNSPANNYGIDATWIGIGGLNTDDLIQAGTQRAIDGNDQASYEAFFETLPDASQPVNLSVKGGDNISASVMKNGSATWRITLSNNTTGQKTEFNVDYPSSLSSAEWIEEAPSGEKNILPLDNFGTVTFTNASVVEKGQQLTLNQTHAQAMHMGSSRGQVIATASVVGNDGASFSVSRTNASVNLPDVAYRMHFRHGFGRIPFIMGEY